MDSASKRVAVICVALACIGWSPRGGGHGGSSWHGGYSSRGYSGHSYGYNYGYVPSPICQRGTLGEVKVDRELWFDGADIGLPGYRCVGKRYITQPQPAAKP